MIKIHIFKKARFIINVSFNRNMTRKTTYTKINRSWSSRKTSIRWSYYKSWPAREKNVSYNVVDTGFFPTNMWWTRMFFVNSSGITMWLTLQIGSCWFISECFLTRNVGSGVFAFLIWKKKCFYPVLSVLISESLKKVQPML